MQKKWKNLSLELAVGFFFIIAMLILGLTCIVLNRDLLKGNNIKTYTVSFAEIGGLAVGDRILIKGVDVGRVRTIKFVEENVHISFSIDPSIAIYPDYTVRIGSTSLLGGKNILLNNGTPQAGTPLTESVILAGETPQDVMETLGEFAREIKESKIIDNLGATSEKLKSITAKINAGEGLLGELINNKQISNDLKTTIQNVSSISADIKEGKGTIGKLITSEESHDNLNKTLNSVTQTADNLADITDSIKQGKGTIGKLVTEDSLYQTYNQAGQSISEITQKLTNGEGTIGRLLCDDGQIHNDLRQLINNLKNASENINKTEGTLGKLINDSELYDEVNMGIKEFRRTVEDYREQSIWSSFGSFIFGSF